jgi:probable addiction module antidote protein
MKTTAYKTADYLKTQKNIVAYLNAALEDGEPAVLLEALRNVAQARGGMEKPGSGSIFRGYSRDCCNRAQRTIVAYTSGNCSLTPIFRMMT